MNSSMLHLHLNSMYGSSCLVLCMQPVQQATAPGGAGCSDFELPAWSACNLVLLLLLLLTVYSNRGVCQLSLNKPQEALADAQRVCELRPTWGKGYFRKGAALEA